MYTTMSYLYTHSECCQFTSAARRYPVLCNVQHSCTRFDVVAKNVKLAWQARHLGGGGGGGGVDRVALGTEHLQILILKHSFHPNNCDLPSNKTA